MNHLFLKKINGGDKQVHKQAIARNEPKISLNILFRGNVDACETAV